MNNLFTTRHVFPRAAVIATGGSVRLGWLLHESSLRCGL